MLSSYHAIVDSVFVARAKEGGESLHIWMGDDRDLMVRLMELGVDGIITNRPALLREVMPEGS